MFPSRRATNAFRAIKKQSHRKVFRLGLDSILILIVGAALVFSGILQFRKAFSPDYVCDLYALDGDVEALARDIVSDKVIDAALDHPYPTLNLLPKRPEKDGNSLAYEIENPSPSKSLRPALRMSARYAGVNDARSEVRDHLRIKINYDTRIVRLSHDVDESLLRPKTSNVLAAIVKAAEVEIGSQRTSIASPIMLHRSHPQFWLFFGGLWLTTTLFMLVSLRSPKESANPPKVAGPLDDTTSPSVALLDHH